MLFWEEGTLSGSRANTILEKQLSEGLQVLFIRQWFF